MNELYHITPHENGRGYKMELSTGNITMPDTPGCYVVSTGCGGGKTESTKSLIRQKYEEGIIYCVDTKVELDKMYNWIIENLCARPGSNLSLTDVLILSSDTQYRDFLSEYQDHPEAIMWKKIILLTHVRFWSDLINFFLIYRPQGMVDAFDGDFETLMIREDLRRYIIFDETPLFIKPFFTMSRAVLGCFSKLNEDGTFSCRTKREMVKYYNTFVSHTDEDPFPGARHRLNRIKIEVVFGMIEKMYPQWYASDNRDYNMSITFTPADLCQRVVKTHIIILEGAGDVLFRFGHNYNLIDVPNKYNCNVIFEPFEFDIRRREVLDHEKFENFITGLRHHLLSSQRMGRRSLVVVWKNSGEIYTADDSTFYELVSSRLQSDRRLDGESYRLIYFGSTDSKSTNDFRDFTDIVLCGTWHIPNNDTYRFQTSFGVDTNNNEHILWAYVQLLSRIGIRKHDGQDYRVWFSNDYSNSFISALDDYFNHNTLRERIIEPERIPEPLRLMIRDSNIGKKKLFTKELCALMDFDPEIREALKVNRRYQVEISLDDIYRIIPRHDKKRGKYSVLRNNLAKIGIELHIS